MIKREHIKNLKWSENADFDKYDITRYFIDENNSFPNNTLFVGVNPKKGYLSYNLFREKLDNVNARLLHRSENFNSGIRKLYFDLDGTLFLLDSIYNRDLIDLKNYPAELDDSSDDGKTEILGVLTILHKEEILKKEYRDMIDECFIKPKNIHTLGMISRDNTGFFLNEVRLEDKELSHELDLHYGEGFKEFHETLIDKLSSKTKGLVLFHGKHGTGKSFYIKKLIFDITEQTNKKIIMLPASMISYILEPDFNTFLFELTESYAYDDDEDFENDDDDDDNKKNGNDGIILLLEDAEGVLQKRDKYNSNNQSTSNILNLTDGLLNDIFSVQIIATYNTEDDNIDPALKREKRLIAKREFKNLSLDSSKKLAKHLYIEDKIEKEMSVAEIYSMLDKEENDILIDKSETKKAKHLI